MRPEESVQQQGDDPEAIHPLSDITDTELDVYILQYYMDDQSGSFMQETSYSTEVTLPNIDCQNCTLQVIQFMYNDNEPHYFQCADITITATGEPTTDGAGGTTTSGGPVTTASTTGAMGAGGAGGSGIVPPTTTGNAAVTTGGGVTAGTVGGATTGGATTGGATTGGATTGGATTGTPAVTAATVTATSTSTTGTGPTQAADDEGGCSCRTAPGVSGTGWLTGLLALGLLGYRRRPKARR
jgi:MYXO-CTERM domain-containing protein